MTGNFMKNSFDKLLFAYPNNTISCEESDNLNENNQYVNEIKESSEDNNYNRSMFINGPFCNEDCSTNFSEFMKNNLNVSNSSNDKINLELFKFLIESSYKCGYNQGIKENLSKSNK